MESLSSSGLSCTGAKAQGDRGSRQPPQSVSPAKTVSNGITALKSSFIHASLFQSPRTISNLCLSYNNSMSAATPYTDEWVTGSQNIKLFARMQAPPTIKGAVVFVHGFIEHLGRFAGVTLSPPLKYLNPPAVYLGMISFEKR